MSKNKKSLSLSILILVIGILSLSTWIAVRSTRNIAQPIKINEVSVTGTVKLESSPATINLYLGQTKTIDISADPGSDKLTAVELELLYDPSKIQINSFTKTDYLSTYFIEPQITPGKLVSTLVVPPESGGKSGMGIVGKLTLKSLALGTHLISFGPKTIVATLSTDTNSLKKADPIAINIFNSGDFNFDKKIDIFDYNVLVAKYGNPYTIFDYNSLVANYGKISP